MSARPSVAARSWTIAVGRVARSSICSATRSSPRPAIAVQQLCSWYAGLHRAPQPSTWRLNWILIAGIFSLAGMTSKLCWPGGFPPLSPLPDDVTEADELYQNAGEKGHHHTDPADPPRRRANKARGHGTWDTDRPPIAGVVGRSSSQIRLQVCEQSGADGIRPSRILQEGANGRGMITAMVSWKSIPTRSKVSGRVYEASCAP